MGRYIANTDIEKLLQGKVAFTDDPEERNRMSRPMLAMIVTDAETQVELDLSNRYLVPFVGEEGEKFDKLPPTTRLMIVTLCRLMAQIRVLETDFGRGSAVNGANYTEILQKRYDALVDKCVGRFEGSDERFGAFKYPPLPVIARANHNRASDDGFAGMVLSSTRGDGLTFAPSRIQDPSEDWANFDPTDL